MSEKESKIYNIIIVVLSVAIVIAGIILFVKTRPPKINDIEKPYTYNIVLNGDSYMTLYVGDKYVEKGYSAYDSDGNNVSNLVEVSGTVNTSKTGVYEIYYRINNDKAKSEVSRTVEVIKKTSSSTNTNPSTNKVSIDFKLNGNANMSINLNSTFNDPGFTAIDSNKKDLKKFVKVSGSVNTTKAGTYTITYALNYNGQAKTLTRKVTVIDTSSNNTNGYSVKLSPNTLTGGSVTITVQATSNNFSYFILPNGTRSNISPIDYKVTSNGTYEFSLYNKSNVGTKIKVAISNIDNNPPKGSCKYTINSDNTTTYTITATDEKGIDKMVHNGVNYPSNTSSFKVDAIESGGQITLYDKVGNTTTITCTAK